MYEDAPGTAVSPIAGSSVRSTDRSWGDVLRHWFGICLLTGGL